MRVAIDGVGRLVIPKTLRDELGLRGPTDLELTAVDGRLELTVTDVPARVAVTEYVDVAAAFFGPDESGMINAVLDALARQTRPAEFASDR